MDLQDFIEERDDSIIIFVPRLLPHDAPQVEFAIPTLTKADFVFGRDGDHFVILRSRDPSVMVDLSVGRRTEDPVMINRAVASAMEILQETAP